jgi:membrane dipeptidase
MSHPPLIDGHNDTLLVLQRAVHRGEAPSFAGGLPGADIDLPRARAGGFAGGFFACFAPESLDEDGAAHEEQEIAADGSWSVPYDDAIDPGWALEVTLAMAARLLALEREGSLRIVRRVADLEACLADGTLAAILHIEGAEALDPDRLDRLYALHALGLRSVGPVWSRPNAFGQGVPFRHPSSPDVGPGLTDAGRRLVAACNELGVMLDLAHLNERGFWDVAETSSAPLVATHTGAHALTPTARNLTDAQIDAVGASGGIVGINLSAWDISEGARDDPGCPIARWCEHAEHVVGRIGAAHVALGSDFDGATIPDAVGGADGVGRLLDALVSRGWSEADLRAFAHENWLRVLRATWRD